MFGNLLKNAVGSATVTPRKVCDSHECPCGYYFKKGGWTTGGIYKSGGYCIPMGNIGSIR